MRAFCHIPREISTAPSIAVTGSDRNTRRQHSRDKTRINRVSHESVRARINDPMAFLVRDRVRPETSEMNSRPPRERNPGKHQTRQHVDTKVAEQPEWLFPQDLPGPWR